MSDRKERWGFVALWVIILGLFVHAGLAVYFYNFYQRPSVTWSNNPFPMVNKIIHRGEPIAATVSRCSKDNYQAHITRQLQDSILYSLPEGIVEFRKGCVTETRYIPEVTGRVPLDTYKLRNSVEITVRWLWFTRHDKFQTETQTFTVVK